MTAYRIRDWKTHGKNHKDTEVVYRWIAVPTRRDSKAYKRLTKHPEKVAIFCAFILMLEVAATCPVRGDLIDVDGPLDADDLSDATDYPAEIFTLAFDVLTDNKLKINWLESYDVEVSPDKSELVQDKSAYRTVQTEQTSIVPIGDGRGVAAARQPQGTPPGFHAFWSEWPKHFRKKGRSKCLRKWERDGLESMAEVIVDAVRRCKKSEQWTKQGAEFIPLPMSWLNDDAWEVPADVTAATAVVSDNGFERAPFTREVAEAIGAPWPVILADGTEVGQ